jgi:predicted RNA-binding Zn-ribbon protein involved in translation (DUF1610 family)
MKQIPCPSCGAAVNFQSSVSIFAVCPYCTSMLVRRDMDIESLGKMAALTEDSSPLQIGSAGKYEGIHFQLIGRVRQVWSDGFWNEWFTLFDDARRGWLAEFQGFYSINFECDLTTAIPPLSKLSAGAEISIQGKPYHVDDIKKVICAGSQGELPFRAIRDRRAVSVDLGGAENVYGCIEYSDDGVRFFAGRYCELDQLAFTNLRQLDGW